MNINTKNQITEICPHCGTAINKGAMVCTGCQAERHTGPKQETIAPVFVAGAVLGYLLFKGHSPIEAAIISGFVVTVLYCVACSKKVRWVRRYKTN